MTTETLKNLGASDLELLSLLSKEVDDSMLTEISLADYGNDREEHLRQLIEIKAGNFPSPMEWCPSEVLELMRWSDPEESTWKPGATGQRGHWMRLFCCTALIRSEVEPENYGRDAGQDSTLIKFVDSALKLGVEVSLSALKFLNWRMQTQPLNEWDRPQFATALLILLASRNQCDRNTAHFLVGEDECEQLVISELLDGCLYAQLWKKIIHNLLIESGNTPSYLSKIGENLICCISAKS